VKRERDPRGVRNAMTAMLAKFRGQSAPQFSVTYHCFGSKGQFSFQNSSTFGWLNLGPLSVPLPQNLVGVGLNGVAAGKRPRNARAIVVGHQRRGEALSADAAICLSPADDRMPPATIGDARADLEEGPR
jgi:hypothetical protein